MLFRSMSICLQLLFQFVLAPFILDNLPNDNIIRKAWLDGCDTASVEGINVSDDTQLRSCVSIGGNFRVAAVTTFFFFVATIVAYCQPTANREAWPIKIILYLIMIAATIIVPNEPYFTPIYFVIAIGTLVVHHTCIYTIYFDQSWISYPYHSYSYLHSAVGGVIFICLQQVVILDCSYNWNDSWYVQC